MTLFPTDDEIQKWLLKTLKHSMQVEYFAEKIKVKIDNDYQRPHDITGKNSKFDWNVIKGLALQYRKPQVNQNLIYNAINNHRKQLHHQFWNYDDPNATWEDLKIGAIDSICTYLEKRSYIGKELTLSEIETTILKTNRDHPRRTITGQFIIYEMKNIKLPNIHIITTEDNIHNIGISTNTYNEIIKKYEQAMSKIKEYA